MLRIRSIPQIYRNINRWTELISVLSKYGLADWLSRLNLDFAKGIFRDRAGEAIARHTFEERIRMALAELGPTFIKLGQMLSMRPDLVGFKLADELKNLQANVPADKPEQVRKTIEEELGQPIEELFSEFDPEPLASASIGQVHAAKLKSGEKVVIKVQHRGIRDTVREDTEILIGLAMLAERVEEFANYRPAAVAAEFQRALRRELEFGREERNLILFAAEFEDDEQVAIPKPLSELSAPSVLTMERIDGIKFSQLSQEKHADQNLEEVARHGAEIYARMIFENGFYHADPHPGNLLLLPDGVIGMLDFGQVGRMDERLREQIETLLLGIADQDTEHVATIIMRIGDVPVAIDEVAFRTEVADFVAHYGSQPMERFDLSGALHEMTEMIHRYKISLPPQVALLLKTLITLEGTSKHLSPTFSIIEVIKPLRRQIFLRRYSPRRQLRKWQRLYGEFEYVAEAMPRRVLEIVEQVRSGDMGIRLDHRGLQPSVNRLVYGMIVSAMFLGSSLMLSMKVPPVLFTEKTWFGLHNISLIGCAGIALSTGMGLWLLRAIWKSGHLDRRE